MLGAGFHPKLWPSSTARPPRNGAEHQLQAYLLNHVFRVLHLIPPPRV